LKLVDEEDISSPRGPGVEEVESDGTSLLYFLAKRGKQRLLDREPVASVPFQDENFVLKEVRDRVAVRHRLAPVAHELAYVVGKWPVLASIDHLDAMLGGCRVNGSVHPRVAGMLGYRLRDRRGAIFFVCKLGKSGFGD
jgi:hypothetical protein